MSFQIELSVTRRATRKRRPQRAPADALVLRRSQDGDQAALERLAALDSRELPAGTFCLAEVDGELVAAAPLDVEDAPLADPFKRTADVVELLELQARRLRSHPTTLRKAA
jgi:hypothetical protein